MREGRSVLRPRSDKVHRPERLDPSIASGTTLKVPQGFSMERQCDFLAAKTGATAYRMMPAKRLFALASDTCDAAD